MQVNVLIHHGCVSPHALQQWLSDKVIGRPFTIRVHARMYMAFYAFCLHLNRSKHWLQQCHLCKATALA